MNNLLNINLGNNEVPKNYITIIFEDKESRVSWYADTSLEDARFSIICACDALVDAEFEVLDDKAKLVDLNTIKEFKNGSVYFLRKKATNKPTNILLDGRRKLFVEIEPLKHVEAQVAIKYMIIGSNLLKHTKKGFPHIRLFQLSQDLKRILWYTKTKKITDAQVSIDSIEDLTIGQTSDNFSRYPLKMLEEFSFSIYYTKEGKIHTLDLTCKDEREFDLWVIGIKALHSHFNKKIICKNHLLSHSRSYKEQVEKGNIGSCSKFLIYNNDRDKTSNFPKDSKFAKKSLEKFIVSRNLSQFEISKLFLKLATKIRALRNDVEQISLDNEYKLGKEEEGYEMIFDEEAIVDDLDTQKSQMVNLFKQCENNCAIFLKEFLWYSKEHRLNSHFNIHEDDMDDFMKTLQELEIHLNTHLPDFSDFDPDKINIEFFLKELDIQLWKIEIDIENVSDIIKRFKTPLTPGIFDSIKNFFKKNLN